MNDILILHGWGIGSKTWGRTREILERQGWKVYVPDLPGFGESPPLSRTWSMDDYVDWAKGYCDENGLSQFFLIGHSFGGGIAVKFVNNFPGRVKGLVLVAPKVHRQKTLRYYGGLILARIGKLVFSFPPLSFLQSPARRILYRIIGVKDWRKLKLEETGITRETFKRIVGLDIISYLPTIKIPTLIIWGDQDKITPISDAYLIKQAIGGSQLEIIKHGRHALNIENPEVLAEKIIEFIK